MENTKLDPRVNSPEQLVAPHPLPFVSRRCLARVKDWMAPPTSCRYCNAAVNLVTHIQVYGKNYGEWPYLYLCSGCGAYVGLHPKTDLPLGTIANKQLRIARTDSKSAFMHMIKFMCVNLDNGYKILATHLNIPPEECHFGWFEVDRCQEVKRYCQEIYRTFGDQ